MTEQEFIEKATALGYGKGWIEKAIEKMNKLNSKFSFGFSFNDNNACDI